MLAEIGSNLADRRVGRAHVALAAHHCRLPHPRGGARLGVVVVGTPVFVLQGAPLERLVGRRRLLLPTVSRAHGVLLHLDGSYLDVPPRMNDLDLLLLRSAVLWFVRVRVDAAPDDEDADGQAAHAQAHPQDDEANRHALGRTEYVYVRDEQCCSAYNCTKVPRRNANGPLPRL